MTPPTTPPGEALPASALPLPHEVLVWRGMKATPTILLIDALVVGDQLEKALIEETARRRRAEVLLFATQQTYVREHEAVVQSEIASRWIPVSERLPKSAERVLFFDRNYGRLIGEHLDATDSWHREGEYEYPDDICQHVTHWMPLPEKP